MQNCIPILEQSKYQTNSPQKILDSVIGHSDFNNFKFKKKKLTKLYYQNVELYAEFKAVKQNSNKIHLKCYEPKTLINM
jgi:hypothetical protein